MVAFPWLPLQLGILFPSLDIIREAHNLAQPLIGGGHRQLQSFEESPEQGIEASLQTVDQ